MTVHGNLQIMGSTLNTDVIDSVITDNTITLNHGAVTPVAGGAYVKVERGFSPTVAVYWNEGVGSWQLTNDGTTYTNIAVGGATLSGSNTWVQFNDQSNFGANINFTYDKAANQLTAGNVTLSSGSVIGTVGTNANLVLDPDGSGYVNANAVVGLYYQSAPGSVASNVFIYANTPGAAGSGIYYVNTDNSGELISKKKAQLYAWIF
jgi:hypothetical protein